MKSGITSSAKEKVSKVGQKKSERKQWTCRGVFEQTRSAKALGDNAG